MMDTDFKCRGGCGVSVVNLFWTSCEELRLFGMPDSGGKCSLTVRIPVPMPLPIKNLHALIGPAADTSGKPSTPIGQPAGWQMIDLVSGIFFLPCRSKAPRSEQNHEPVRQEADANRLWHPRTVGHACDLRSKDASLKIEDEEVWSEMGTWCVRGRDGIVVR